MGFSAIIHNLVYFIIVVILLFVIIVFVTSAASALPHVDGYQSDKKLKTAHTYLTWSSIILWISLALIVGIMILLLVFGEAIMKLAGGWIIKIMVVFLVFLTLGAGIMSSIAAAQINGSDLKGDKKAKQAYSDCIWAAILSFGFVVLAGLVFFIKYKHHKKQVEQAAIKNRQVLEQKKQKLEEIKQKQQSVTSSASS